VEGDTNFGWVECRGDSHRTVGEELVDNRNRRTVCTGKQMMQHLEIDTWVVGDWWDDNYRLEDDRNHCHMGLLEQRA
jgi:hypothetical protein